MCIQPIETVLLGNRLSLEEFVAVARYGAKVEFSPAYVQRVSRARALVDQWTDEGRVMYGITTGVGLLYSQNIEKKDTAQLQENILLSHSVSVGNPLNIEQVRGIMLMVLQSLGQGYSGVRLSVLERYRDFLNLGLTPWAPGSGSVGYLSPEAHIALVLLGKGKAYYRGKLLSGTDALSEIKLDPIALSSKEGLSLISGTTSVTALAALAVYDFEIASKSADIIAAISFEALGGSLNAYDPRVMEIRPHEHQKKTALNIRRILSDSRIFTQHQSNRLQDPLSLRCVPQLHGAVKKTIADARKTIEIELNSCCDNPIIWPEKGCEDILSACNPDSSYVGLEMDSVCIAAVGLAKMSERRNCRLLDGTSSGAPWFCVRNPGLNSGLMVPQYTQAGLLNELRMLATPSTIDNTSTCGNQEDYVAMGYNACKKAGVVAELLDYILAIELLSAFQIQQFVNLDVKKSSATTSVLNTISKHVPVMRQDMFLHPHIEYLKALISSGNLLSIIESKIGTLD